MSQAIATERRTIDIQINQASGIKAAQMAQESLSKNAEWIKSEKEKKILRDKRFEQYKGHFFWFGRWVISGRFGIFFFLCYSLIPPLLAVAAVINLPTFLVCSDAKSLCYSVYKMRLEREGVILPSQADKILSDYERNKKKKR